jgi:hypothetical protein
LQTIENKAIIGLDFLRGVVVVWGIKAVKGNEYSNLHHLECLRIKAKQRHLKVESKE